MTVEDFEAQMNDLGQALSSIDEVLLNAGGKLIADMKQKVPFDTGALYSSLGAVVEDNSLKISMLTYGAFQNYGVAGTDGDSRFGVVDEVPSAVQPGPLRGSKYQFKERRFGLPAQDFFDTNTMTDYLAQAVEDYITNQIQY